MDAGDWCVPGIGYKVNLFVETATPHSIVDSIKMVGLFVVSLVGLATIVDLWRLIDFRRGLTEVGGCCVYACSHSPFLYPHPINTASCKLCRISSRVCLG